MTAKPEDLDAAARQQQIAPAEGRENHCLSAGGSIQMKKPGTRLDNGMPGLIQPTEVSISPLTSAGNPINQASRTGLKTTGPTFCEQRWGQEQPPAGDSRRHPGYMRQVRDAMASPKSKRLTPGPTQEQSSRRG